jgi:pimeloyl-ACP methyl ester carboxylesterase
LPQITVPTLVLHRQGDKAVRIAAGRDVASRIPGAQFVELDGHDHWFFAGDQRPVLEAVRRFAEALQP